MKATHRQRGGGGGYKSISRVVAKKKRLKGNFCRVHRPIRGRRRLVCGRHSNGGGLGGGKRNRANASLAPRRPSLSAPQPQKGALSAYH